MHGTLPYAYAAARFLHARTLVLTLAYISGIAYCLYIFELFCILANAGANTLISQNIVGGAYQRARWGIKLNCKLYTVYCIYSHVSVRYVI